MRYIRAFGALLVGLHRRRRLARRGGRRRRARPHRHSSHTGTRRLVAAPRAVALVLADSLRRATRGTADGELAAGKPPCARRRVSLEWLEALQTARAARSVADLPTRHPESDQKDPVCRDFLEADARTRTGDPFITSEVLYQLSYVGEAG